MSKRVKASSFLVHYYLVPVSEGRDVNVFFVFTQGRSSWSVSLSFSAKPQTIPNASIPNANVKIGNGTQRAFLEDPDVLYISLHRYEGGTFYPCGPFGGLDSCGEGAGLGK